MSAAELQRAIGVLATAGGWELKTGLLELILQDIGDEPGALPLFSHALRETGERGTLAKTAQDTFDRLPADQPAIARHIFLSLTELGEDTQDTQ